MGGMSSSSDDCRGWASVYSSSSSEESGNLMSPKEVTGLFIAEDGTEACWEVEEPEKSQEGRRQVLIMTLTQQIFRVN